MVIKIKNEILTEIANGNLDRAIHLIVDNIITQKNDIELILICFDYNSLVKKESRGIIKFDDELNEKRKIIIRIFNYFVDSS